MRHHTIQSPFLRLMALPFTVVSVVAFSLPATSVTQEYRTTPLGDRPGNYEACVNSLSRLQLASTEVAAACGAALYPESLGECVSRISGDTTIAAADALSGCRRVRRPNDLATCVVDISRGNSDGTVLTNVLDNCRRSLLPVRFSSCVVGLRDGLDGLSTDAAMTNCIASSDRPRDFLPTFIPIGQEIPLPGSDQTAIPATTGTTDSTGTPFTPTPLPAPAP